MKKAAYLLFFLMAGCGPSSLEDFKVEGEAICRLLVKDLRHIHTHDELAKNVPQLQKRFHDLVDLIIQARTYQLQHPDDDETAAIEEYTYSEELKEELRRIYALEGGREAIQKAEREALFRLDAFEKNLIKQNQRKRT